jgi:hypothetical protein
MCHRISRDAALPKARVVATITARPLVALRCHVTCCCFRGHPFLYDALACSASAWLETASRTASLACSIDATAIDGNACFPLQPVGATLIMSHICLTLRLGNDPFQRVNIGGNFRSYRGPVLNGCVASGLNFSFHLFGCLRGCSMCFLFAVSIFSCTSFEAAAIASSAFLARTELVLPLCGSRFSQCTSFEAAAIASSAFLARTERSASCCDSG